MSLTPRVDFTRDDYLNDTLGPIGFTANYPLVLNMSLRALSIMPASALSAGSMTTSAQTFAGTKTFSSVPLCASAPTTSDGLANKGYVDSLVKSISWQDEVYSFWDFATPPAAPQPVGRRYISTTTASGATQWYIYQVASDGASFIEIVPEEGFAVAITSDVSILFANQTCIYNGATWVNLGSSITHMSLVGLSGDDHPQYVKVAGRLADVVSIPNATASTSTITGALTVVGGAGFGGRVWATNLSCSTAPVASTDVMRLGDYTSDRWTGFPVGSSALSGFSITNPRTVNIGPTGANFTYYHAGTLFTKAALESITLANTSGMHFIYYNGATLSETVIVNDTLWSMVLVAIAYVNSATGFIIWMGDERHTVSMSPATHRSLHYANGASYVSGLTPADFVIGDGSLDVHAEFSNTSGQILDEDLPVDIDTRIVGQDMKVFVLDGSAWVSTTSNGPFYTNLVALRYNRYSGGVWSSEPVANNRYVLGHIIATNDYVGNKRIAGILGQAEYTSVAAASAGAINEVQSLYTVGLPLSEFVFIATVIYQCGTGYANLFKGRIVNNSSGTAFIDWRRQRLTSTAGTVQSHGALSNLTTDDHPQYFTVAGRTGESLTVRGDILMPQYSYINMLGGNSQAYLQTSFAVFGDGVYLQYNQHSNGATTVLDNPAGSTSGVQCGYGYVSLRAGAAGVVATDVAAALPASFTLYQPLVGGNQANEWTNTWSPVASGSSTTVYAQRLSKGVQIMYADWGATLNASAGSLGSMTWSTVLTSIYRPSIQIGLTIMYSLDGTAYTGYLQVSTSGVLTLYPLPSRTVFIANAVLAVKGMSLSYAST